jgi:hypothetical protein
LNEAHDHLGATLRQRVLQAFLDDEFQVEKLTRDDLERSLVLAVLYANKQIGLVDASIVSIAERLRITGILTLDRRHFQVFHPRHGSALEIGPRSFGRKDLGHVANGSRAGGPPAGDIAPRPRRAIQAKHAGYWKAD